MVLYVRANSSPWSGPSYALRTLPALLAFFPEKGRLTKTAV